MEEKLNKLYHECIEELKSIGLNIANNPEIGEITIEFSNRSVKRYGCCKQENPDKTTMHRKRKGRTIYITYDRYLKHKIEISRWVMDLDDKIIKNTIIHEIIHCFPKCNNHGTEFKKYANYINKKLNYDISRLGDKKADYKKSNVKYENKPIKYKYKIICKKCGHIYYRQRLKKNITTKYRCSICNGRLKVELL